MWGWGRGSKDDDGNSNNTNSTTHTSASTTSKLAGSFGLVSPRSPTSLSSSATTPKKITGFSGGKQNASNTNQRNSIGVSGANTEFSKQRRKSWGGKRINNNSTGISNIAVGDEILTAVTIMEKGPSLTESFSGIEVSLSRDKNNNYDTKGYSPPKTSHVNVLKKTAHLDLQSRNNSKNGSTCKGGTSTLSLHAYVLDSQKVHHGQFLPLHHNLEKPPLANSSSSATLTRAQTQHFSPISHQFVTDTTKPFKHKGDHRIPLFDIRPPQLNYDQALALLKGHEVKEEAQCLNDEIEYINKEIAALERDKMQVEQIWNSNRALGKESAVTNNSRTIDEFVETDFDINRQLLKSVGTNNAKGLPSSQVMKLQKQRGVCLTVSIENAKALESLLSKLGGKATTLPMSSVAGFHRPKSTCLVTTLRPSNEGRMLLDENSVGSGAACSIQQATLLSSSSTEGSSFFLSTDTGNVHYYGKLPDRLFRRLKANSASRHQNQTANSTGTQNVFGIGNNHDPHQFVRDLFYLSTGPCGCYYAELRSGECWWGLTPADDELDAIFNEWDIYRIAFGPCVTLDSTSAPTSTNRATSWIVIARDGKAAWKNLPSRLHGMLSSRLANDPTPTEIALGCEGSYFVRFSDGKFVFIRTFLFGCTCSLHLTVKPYPS